MRKGSAWMLVSLLLLILSMSVWMGLHSGSGESRTGMEEYNQASGIAQMSLYALQEDGGEEAAVQMWAQWGAVLNKLLLWALLLPLSITAMLLIAMDFRYKT